MSRNVIMVTCPECGHTFPAKENKGTVGVLARLGASAGVGFAVGGPIGAGVGSIAGCFWGALSMACKCPKCGTRMDRPTVQ